MLIFAANFNIDLAAFFKFIGPFILKLFVFIPINIVVHWNNIIYLFRSTKTPSDKMSTFIVF